MHTIIRRIAKALIYIFAFVGFCDLLFRWIIFPFTGTIYGYVLKLPNDYDIQQVIFSDDRSLKAVIYIWSGPAFDAGCDKMVAVVDAATSVQTAWKSDNLVFQAGCDEFFHVAWEPPADGRVRPRLRIDADAGKGDLMSRLAMGGRVAVAFRGDH